MNKSHIKMFTYFLAVFALASLTTSQDPPLFRSHVRDLMTGNGIPNVTCRLYTEGNGTDGWVLLAQTTTDDRGLVDNMITHDEFVIGNYRLVFYTRPYYKAQNISSFYPYIEVLFEKTEPDASYSIPILISPYGYSTYRGSSA